MYITLLIFLLLAVTRSSSGKPFHRSITFITATFDIYSFTSSHPDCFFWSLCFVSATRVESLFNSEWRRTARLRHHRRAPGPASAATQGRTPVHYVPQLCPPKTAKPLVHMSLSQPCARAHLNPASHPPQSGQPPTCHSPTGHPATCHAPARRPATC
jgi:hypothetical protein